jgi:phosphonoacetaldehyde hydrolase
MKVNPSKNSLERLGVNGYFDHSRVTCQIYDAANIPFLTFIFVSMNLQFGKPLADDPRPHRRTYSGPLTAAIFDWAGTVLDFGSIAPVVSFRQVFEEAGVPISEAEARAPMGAAKREHVALLLQNPAIHARWQAAHGQAPQERDIDELYAGFLRVDELNVAHHSALIPGALETMAALRARGIRIGSTTGYPREVMANLAPIAAKLG